MNEKLDKIVDNFNAVLDDMLGGLEKNNENTAFQHTQKGGTAHYDDSDKFLFTPDDPVERTISPFRGVGVAQMLSDGTFDFIRQPRLRAQSQLIRKLAHGRVSHTKDGAVQLTLKVYGDEGVNISHTISEEAEAASLAVADWLLKGSGVNK